MLLEIITPEKQIFNGDVTSVKFPGINGGFEILNNHAPIISTLKEGEIRVITSDKKIATLFLKKVKRITMCSLKHC